MTFSISSTQNSLTSIYAKYLSNPLVGPTGPHGTPGSIGPKGPTGAPGNADFTGPTGYIGYLGPTGTPGIADNIGPTGSTGFTGFIGPVGPTGTPGMASVEGATGYTGYTGPAGMAVTASVIGPVGPIGHNGSAGSQGPINNASVVGFYRIYGNNSGALTHNINTLKFDTKNPLNENYNLNLIIRSNPNNDSLFTVTKAGIYKLTCQLSINTPNGNSVRAQIISIKGPTSILTTEYLYNQRNYTSNTLVLNVTIYLDAFEIIAVQTSTTGSSWTNNIPQMFCITRLS